MSIRKKNGQKRLSVIQKTNRVMKKKKEDGPKKTETKTCYEFWHDVFH